MERNCIRRKTINAGIAYPAADLVEKLIAYILNIRRLRMKHGYIDRNIIAMDETHGWQDMLSDATADSTGWQSFRMNKTEHEKIRILVYLATKADGQSWSP